MSYNWLSTNRSTTHHPLSSLRALHPQVWDSCYALWTQLKRLDYLERFFAYRSPRVHQISRPICDRQEWPIHAALS